MRGAAAAALCAVGSATLSGSAVTQAFAGGGAAGKAMREAGINVDSGAAEPLPDCTA